MRASLVLLAFQTVLLFEFVGDKTFYVVSSLATRYGPLSVLAGVAPAAGLKMAAAVAFAGLLSHLPHHLTSALAAVTFLGAAVALWREPAVGQQDVEAARAPGIAAGFLAVFSAEWGDPGQLAAAALAVSSGNRGSVWLGATSAMVAKAIVAVTLGVSVRRFIPRNVARYAAVALCVAMGILSALQIEL